MHATVKMYKNLSLDITKQIIKAYYIQRIYLSEQIMRLS